MSPKPRLELSPTTLLWYTNLMPLFQAFGCSPTPQSFACPALMTYFPAKVKAHFQKLLQQGVDEAWTFVSDWTERLLFKKPRLDQSPGLRALRRLVQTAALCTSPLGRPTAACLHSILYRDTIPCP